jgi:hypothetical protein
MLFRRDLMAALRTGDIGMNETILYDLEQPVIGLIRKIADSFQPLSLSIG